MVTQKILIEKLLNLKNQYGITGIKQSTEDEGAIHQDICTMRRITDLCGLDLSVKIGGCEAKTDIHFCQLIGVNKIVAPMIESKFALLKFLESVQNIDGIKYYINIESHQGQHSIEKILDSCSESKLSKKLSGIVVGRSDMIKSYYLDKSNVEGYVMNNIVEKVFGEAKLHSLDTIMGGNISPKSNNIINKLYNDKRLDYIETRNVIIKLNDNNIKKIPEVIEASLLFESNWLQYKSNYYNTLGKQYTDRSKLILKRL